jgi:Ca-activated chloride channel homolog
MKVLNIGLATILLAALAAFVVEPGSLRLNAGQSPDATPGLARQRTPEAPVVQAGQQIPESRISVETALVNLDVLVTDKDGRALSGLKRENFRVLDDGKAQAITHFEPIRAPITIAMLMEYSGRAYNYFAYKAASWGSNFLDHLDPLDWVGLVTYDLKPTVQVDFTRNKVQVQQTLSNLSYPQFREANLYDAIIDTLDRLDRTKGKKALLVISTGANTMSAQTLNDTFRRIEESDVTIFSVGVAESEYQQAEARISGVRSISYLQAKNQLQTFAKLSGGASWFPRFEGEIPGIFRSVAAFLRSQYSIGFSPENLAHDRKYHKLKVEIVQPDGSPLIVTNAKGKRQKPVVYAREGYTAPGGSLHD